MTVIATQGNEIRVSKFKLYDIAKDEFVVSRRWARLLAIEKIGAVQVGPFAEIPIDDIDADGFTALDYVPATKS